jgi:hypothetical protein
MGEHASAIHEFERFIYYRPDHPLVPYVRYLAALSYAREDQYSRAVARLQRLIDDLESGGDVYPGLGCECRVQLLNLHFREKRFREFELAREYYLAECTNTDPQLEGWVRNLTLAVQVYNRGWDQALALLEEFPPEDRIPVKSLEAGLRELREHRNRSPVIGGLLSIIPGLGYAYGGSPVNGFRSFVMNAVGIGLTIFCFLVGMPVLGTLFGVIETVLYSVNIYGGINTVVQHNARFIVERRDALLRMIPVPPLDWLTFSEERLFGERQPPTP